LKIAGAFGIGAAVVFGGAYLLGLFDDEGDLVPVRNNPIDAPDEDEDDDEDEEEDDAEDEDDDEGEED
jgi:hypothetical protein